MSNELKVQKRHLFWHFRRHFKTLGEFWLVASDRTVLEPTTLLLLLQCWRTRTATLWTLRNRLAAIESQLIAEKRLSFVLLIQFWALSHSLPPPENRIHCISGTETPPRTIRRGKGKRDSGRNRFDIFGLQIFCSFFVCLSTLLKSLRVASPSWSFVSS